MGEHEHQHADKQEGQNVLRLMQPYVSKGPI
jgi:hypothetical protein